MVSHSAALEIALQHGQEKTQNSIAEKETASQELANAVQEAKALSHDLAEAIWRAQEAERLIAEIQPTMLAASRAIKGGLELQEEVIQTQRNILSLNLTLVER